MKFWKYRDRSAVDGHGNFVVGDAPRVASTVGPSDADVREAYKKGRHDEKARHKSHPILALIVFALAVVGGIMLFLVLREGSFSSAGKVADQQVAVAKAEGPDVARNAASQAGQAAREATDGNPST
ncbi:MAG TPA: hypothetical protein VF559_13245 [Caulobacteraceae bacterium]|jgi:hypothetical protein